MIRRATPDAIAAAAALLRRGEVVAFPTETVYGLGADATNARAVAQIYAIKARPAFDPLIVHLADAAALTSVAEVVPDAAITLTRRLWPGPLTVVLRKTSTIPDIVTAGLSSVAVRVPDHPVARSLIAATGRPLAAPSANPFGYISPTAAEHVRAQLGEQLPLILDGGPCRVGVESSIVSFVDAVPVLLRAGGISLEDIEAIIGPVRVDTDRTLPLAPGQLARHYAPRTPIAIVDSPGQIAVAERAGIALLLPQPDADTSGFAHVEVLSSDGQPTTMAANLFAALRRLDDANYARIVAVAVPEVGIGRAIMDRLRRASR
jgi:L-threonylcarbamoyladenylate synthase